MFNVKKQPLIANTETLTITITWSDESQKIYTIHPGNGWFDVNGYLRVWSGLSEEEEDNLSGIPREMWIATGRTYRLLPKKTLKSAVIRLCRDFFVPHGVKYVSQQMIPGEEPRHNLARMLFETSAKYILDYFLSEEQAKESAYYDTYTGDLFINRSLRLDLDLTTRQKFKMITGF